MKISHEYYSERLSHRIEKSEASNWSSKEIHWNQSPIVPEKEL